MSKSEKPTIPALTGLRFIAALHVLLLHAALPLVDGGPPLIRNLIGSGYIGVSLFFVLSGFILTYNYLDDGGPRELTTRSFWAARFARVYPVYALGILVWLPIFYREIASTEAAVLPQLITGTLVATLLVQSWYPTSVYFLNPPGWSLSVEAFFYTMFPVLGRIFKRLNASKLVIIGVTCWVAGLAVPLWYLVQNPDRVGYGSAEMKVFWLDAIKFNPLVRLPEFVIGMIAGRFFLMKKRLGGMSPGWHSFLGVVVVSAVLAGSSLIPYPLLHNGLLAPVYAYFIFALAHGEGRIAQFLATPVLVLLGEASYSLYLLHLPIARWMLKGAHTIGVNTSTILYFCVYTIVAIGMSIVVLKLVEEPARRFIRSRFQRRKSAAGQKAVV